MADWSARNARTMLGALQAAGSARGLRMRSFQGRSLRGEIFSPGEDLSDADLKHADLTGAQLSGTRLTGACLVGAWLESSQLDGADLRGADLSGAVLDGASLIGADLRGCELADTSWRRARLTGAKIDLSGTRPEHLLGAALPETRPRLCLPYASGAESLAISDRLGLLAVSSGGTVQLWDLVSERCLTVLGGDSSWVTALALCDLPDGRTLLAAGAEDGSVEIFDASTGARLRRMCDHDHWVESMALGNLPEGRTVLASSSSSSVRVWDAISGEALRIDVDGRPDHGPLALGTLPDGRSILVLSARMRDGSGVSIQIVDMATGRSHGTIAHPGGSLHQLALGQLSNRLTAIAACDLDDMVSIWDASTGELLRRITTPDSYSSSLAFNSPRDGHPMLAIGARGTITLWDPAGGPLHTFSEVPSLTRALAFGQLPNGRPGLASSGHDHTLQIWDPIAGQPSGTLVTHRNTPLRLATATAASSLDAKAAVESLIAVTPAGGAGPVLVLDPTRRARRAAISSHLARITGIALGHLSETRAGIAHGRLSEARTILAIAGERAGSRQTSIDIWDATQGRWLDTITTGLEGPHAIEVGQSSDGRALVCVAASSIATGESIGVWDADTGEPMHVITRVAKRSPSLTAGQLPDGRMILATTDAANTATRVWDAASGEALYAIPGEELPSGLASRVAIERSSPGRTILATIGRGRSICLFDATTGAPIGTIDGHLKDLFAIALARLADGRMMLAAGDVDGSVHLWDLSERLARRHRRLPFKLGRGVRSLTTAPVLVERFPAGILSLRWIAGTSTLAIGLGHRLVLARLEQATLVEQSKLLSGGAGCAELFPDGSYRLTGDASSSFWWSSGLCRFEPGELDGYAGIRRLP
jgi:WD40 repeat protein